LESAPPGQLRPHTLFYWRHLWLPLAVGLPALVLLEVTGLDHAISRWFFDDSAMRFPIRYSAAFEMVTHNWAKKFSLLVACVACGALFASFVAPRLRAHRRVLLFLVLGPTLAPVTVTVMKHNSHRSCPWDLVEFGGTAPFVGLFDTPPPGHYPGRCFPSGHASNGFGLLAFYFGGRAVGRKRLAMMGLWGGATAGLCYGLARLVQGAHFLSHVLWSGLICWLVILLLYVLVIGPEREPR
jgi:membrane-associated PAP2 superfamily phosphatase